MLFWYASVLLQETINITDGSRQIEEIYVDYSIIHTSMETIQKKPKIVTSVDRWEITSA